MNVAYVSAVLLGGLVAGALDIAFAISFAAYNGTPPARLLRLVALPVSAFPYPVTFKPVATILDLLSHTILFGVPIALAIRRAVRPPLSQYHRSIAI
jgi:hypothetical protein